MGVVRLAVFGSAARGEASAGSDLVLEGSLKAGIRDRILSEAKDVA